MMLPFAQDQLQAAHDEVLRSLEVVPEAAWENRCSGLAS